MGTEALRLPVQPFHQALASVAPQGAGALEEGACPALGVGSSLQRQGWALWVSGCRPAMQGAAIPGGTDSRRVTECDLLVQGTVTPVWPQPVHVCRAPCASLIKGDFWRGLGTAHLGK